MLCAGIAAVSGCASRPRSNAPSTVENQTVPHREEPAKFNLTAASSEVEAAAARRSLDPSSDRNIATQFAVTPATGQLPRLPETFHFVTAQQSIPYSTVEENAVVSAVVDPEEIPSPLQNPEQVSRIRMPFAEGQEKVQLSSALDRISLTAVDAALNVVLSRIAEPHGLNLVTGSEMTERISVRLNDAQLQDTLDVLLATNGYTWNLQKNILIVSKISTETKTSASIQGREMRVFSLNYVTATNVDLIVKGLLSPVGQSFVTQSTSTDHRRTHEQLFVEDLPDNLRRIELYLLQADTRPRQVLIEAHILQVALRDNCRHGVNLQSLLHVSKSNVTLATTGLASGLPPVSTLKIEGTDLNGLLDAIKTNTDSKTLASPKVAVLNNQEATMQVGSKIGYLMTTTTQTSSLQSVNFLDVGVILKVTPSISDDDHILMQVSPQVSTGRINATTSLPESEVTEVSTRVMLGDGEAIVIGGLIKETDIDNQNKIPFLGDLWLVGWLFQRREIIRERNEIIIALVPRIVPDFTGGRCLDPCELERTQTPLLYGPLQPVDRSKFEPKLPSYNDRPRDRKNGLQQYDNPKQHPSVRGPFAASEVPNTPQLVPEDQATQPRQYVKSNALPEQPQLGQPQAPAPAWSAQ